MNIKEDEFFSLFSGRLFESVPLLLLDRKGLVVRTWNEERFVRGSMISAMKEADSILPLFGCKTADMKELFKDNQEPVLFAFQKAFGHDKYLREFYTLLPVCRLNLKALSSDRFLGILQIIPYYTFPTAENSAVTIWADIHTDKLQGLNHFFYSYFKDRYKAPSKLLDLPCSRFFSPSILEIQENYFEGTAKPEDNEYKLAHAHAPESGDWDNPSAADYAFLKIPVPFNPQKEDFCVTLKAETITGSPPIVMAGVQVDKNIFPDAGGYSMGFTPDLKSCYVKRSGLMVADSTCEPASGTLQFFKQGNAYYLLRGEQCLIRYYDFDPLSAEKAWIYLGLRPKAHVRIHRLLLLLKKTIAAQKETLVTLKTDKNRHHTLHHSPNPFLSRARPAINSFMLTDVTELIEEVKGFQVLLSEKEKEERKLRLALDEISGKNLPFVGTNKAVLAIRENAAIAMKSKAPILIQGETGTGKEVLASWIHEQGPCAKGPFVKVDCSTLPPALLESELFGHEKGAFTGAVDSRKGRFEQADNGTVFIDEIHNLNMATQAKLLNFLQDFTVTPVGGTRPRKIDVRVIVASNKRLEDLVKAGTFREDLYFRIAVFNFTLPPLRERLDDLPGLCDLFLRRFCSETGKNVRGFSGPAFQKLYAYSWPGNVRELKNVIQRAVAFCDTAEIGENLLDLSFQGAVRSAAAKKKRAPGRKWSAREWARLNEKHGGNVSRMARETGLPRCSVYYHLRKFSISLPESRKAR